MHATVVKAAPLVGLVCLLGACQTKAVLRSRSEAQAPDPSPPQVAGAPMPTGVIRGHVKFRGRKPIEPAIDFSSNPACDRAHPRPVPAETVMVNRNGALQNTLVWIKSGLTPAHWPTPVAPATLDQSGCLYRPHVLGLMVNQELEILNSDPVNHDVHIEAARNPASNEAEPPRAESLQKRYPAEEIWIPVTCSVHPWMRSYVSVVAHPFFQVTGPDGSFQLSGVPAGSYVLEAIQEKFGRREQRVIVAANQTAAADFVYGE